MAMSLVTNMAATYGFYHGYKHLKSYYTSSAREPQNTIRRKIFNFVQANIIGPADQRLLNGLDAIGRNQWISYLAYLVIVSMVGNIPTEDVKSIYLFISCATPIAREIVEESALLIQSVFTSIKDYLFPTCVIGNNVEMQRLLNMRVDEFFQRY